MQPAAQDFLTHGFVIQKKLLDAKQIQQVREAMRKVVAAQLVQLDQPSYPTLEANLSALFDVDQTLYLKTIGSLWRLHSVQQTLSSPAIANFLGNTLGFGELFIPGGQVVHIQAERLKIENGYFGLGAHQDFPSVQGSLNGVVVWMPLTTVTQEDFPMEVLPGSHLNGLYPQGGPDTQQPYEVSPSLINEDAFIPVTLEPGDVVFMSVFTLHRSAQRGNPESIRIALSTRYDDADDPQYLARQYHSAYQRSVDRENRHGLSNETIKAYWQNWSP